MDFSAGERGTTGAGRHLLLYDGVCGLCNRVTRFVLRRDPAGLFDFASLQSETGRAFLLRSGRHPGDLDTVFVVADYRLDSRRVLSKSGASLFIADSVGGPWRIFAVLRVLPAAVRDFFYDLIARSRYRIFGRYDTCPIPAPEHRKRFIDV